VVLWENGGVTARWRLFSRGLPFWTTLPTANRAIRSADAVNRSRRTCASDRDAAPSFVSRDGK
jgi:hypothetical protein